MSKYCDRVNGCVLCESELCDRKIKNHANTEENIESGKIVDAIEHDEYVKRITDELRGHILSVPLTLLHDAADVLEAAEQRISDLEDDLMYGTVSEPERFGIDGYRMKDLLLFADMCKRNDVQESDLKQAAWNLELAVRAVMNERQEIIKNTMDEITVRFTPDFEKAYEEMMPNCGAILRGEHDEQ